MKSNFGVENISNFISKMFDTEELTDNIIYYLDYFTKKNRGKIQNVKHLNIILVGASGVGKSTLINAILKTNAETNFGKPVTTKLDYYESDEITFLRLVDSRGIEKNQVSGVDGIFNSIQEFIRKRIEDNNPDKFIHCIWYCWNNTRLEDGEIALFQKLSKQYSGNEIPIILVYTQAILEDHIKKAKEYISKELNLNNDFIEVLAQESKISNNSILPPKNLDKLIEISIQRARGTIHSSCYEGL